MTRIAGNVTSICLTSPFHLQPSGELGHVTTRERTSRFIKLSGNICIQIKKRFPLKNVIKAGLGLDYYGIL